MNLKYPPTRTFPEPLDLDQLRRQARALQRAFTSGEPEAVAEVMAHHRVADGGTFGLRDARLVLARSFGFENWSQLKAFVDGDFPNQLPC